MEAKWIFATPNSYRNRGGKTDWGWNYKFYLEYFKRNSSQALYTN